MSTLHGQSQIEPDGSVRIVVPGFSVNTKVVYTLEIHAAAGNGHAKSAAAPRRRTGKDRLDSLRRLAGSMDDPTFVRPPQGEYEKRESMD